MTPTDRKAVRERGALPWWMRALGSRRREGYELTDVQMHEIKRAEKPVYGGARLALGLTFGLTYFYALRALAVWMPAVSPWLRSATLVMVLSAIGLALNWWINNSSRMARVRYRKLREFGFPICAHCGYDLSAGDPNAGNCPECGRDLSKMPEVPKPDKNYSSSSPPSSSSA